MVASKRHGYTIRDPYLVVADAAAVINVSERTIYAWLANGKLRGYKAGASSASSGLI